VSVDIAVVVPAHNAAAYLAQALASLQQQSLPPREVVVVDDASTDDTADVARQHGAVVLRQQERRGPGAARNRGIGETRSPLIAFLDADDWFGPSKLERQSERLRALGAQTCGTDAWVVDGDRVMRCKNEGRGVPGVLTLEKLMQGNPLICSTVMLRRSALEQVGAFDEDPALIATEDYDLWLRLARREPIAYIDEPLAFYRVHKQSLSANTRFLRGVDRIMDKLQGAFADEPHFMHLVRRRRADVRLDLAWDLLQAGGRRAEARQLIREATKHAFTLKGCRMWLRSLVAS
jgi:glycosyltransferase involved in cell wall biosynthesis